MNKTTVVPKFTIPLSPEWFEWRTDGARQYAMNVMIEAKPLANCVRDLKAHKAWETHFKDEPKTWERFCREELDAEPEFVDAIVAAFEALEAK